VGSQVIDRIEAEQIMQAGRQAGTTSCTSLYMHHLYQPESESALRNIRIVALLAIYQAIHDFSALANKGRLTRCSRRAPGSRKPIPTFIPTSVSFVRPAQALSLSTCAPSPFPARNFRTGRGSPTAAHSPHSSHFSVRTWFVVESTTGLVVLPIIYSP
jgi:hypothetical protein